MVIDNERKAIFIHIPKTGGVSVEQTIHKSLGGDNVITMHKLIHKPPRIDVDTCNGLHLHSTLYDYKRYYGDRINDFYIFTFVRNPWRRMVSHWEFMITDGYNYNVSEKDKLDFSKFVQIYGSGILIYATQGYKSYITEYQNLKPNFIGKLENINEDMLKVANDLQLDITEVIHANPTSIDSKLHQNWRDYYNPRTKDIVYNIFKEDIEKYNYEFGE